MSSLAIRTSDEHVWDSHRVILEEKYVKENWALHKVMAYMEENHRFIKEKNQYEKYLIHKWKLRKYTDSSQWKAASPVIRRLQQAGQPFELWIDGQKKSASTIQKELNRYAGSSGVFSSPDSVCKLPRGVIIRKPARSEAPAGTVDLPFYYFERYVCMQCPNISSWKEIDSINRMPGEDFGSLANWGLEYSIQKILSAVMLDRSASYYHSNSLVMTPHSVFCASPLYRSILYSLANNFAGIGALPKERVFGYLQHMTSKDFYKAICSTPDYFTTRAIARNLYHASIEVGNAQIVDFLLKEPILGLQVNSLTFSHCNSPCTSVEKAAALMHTHVVKVLLTFKAEVNHSRPLVYTETEPHGALNYLIGRSWGNWPPNVVDEIDSELFFALFDAGGKVDDHSLLRLIKNDRKGRFVPLIISKHIAESHRHWNEEGIFMKVFRYQQPQISFMVLKLMLANNVDLDFPVNLKGKMTVIDEVASYGDLFLVEALLKGGAKLTVETLPCAIESGNETLVEQILMYGAQDDVEGRSRPSALATAISVQNPKTVELLICHQGSGFQKVLECVQVASLWDRSWLEYLLGIPGILDPVELGHCLVRAVHDGKTDVALALLDAGAELEIPFQDANARNTGMHSDNIDGGRYCAYDDPNPKYDDNGTPLAQALHRRNSVLVHALLDAGANPSFINCRVGHNNSVELAVRCGDPDVVNAVLAASTRFDRHGSGEREAQALAMAISSKNKDVIIMLLEAGYEVNRRCRYAWDETPLTAAVGTGDIDMVNFIMEWGADPHDEEALKLAWMQKSTAFDVLLGKHALHYPKGREGWGAEILKDAIDRDDDKSFHLVLEKGADVNYPLQNRIEGDDSYQDVTLFGYAIARSKTTDTKFVQLLLEHHQISGCSPTTVVSELVLRPSGPICVSIRLTAFLAAIGTGSCSMIEVFLRHGANVDCPARLGIKRTPLQRAAENGDVDVVELLLKFGADPDGPAAYKGGGTALQLAAMGGFLRVVQLLLEHGANVNAPKSKVEGRTPLEGAAEHGRLDMVAFLLKAGAGHGGTDKRDFDRAIARAEENGYPYIADLLRQYLATGKISASQPDPVFDACINPDMVEYE